MEQKAGLIQALQKEIDACRDSLQKINSIISKNSFISAESLLDAETFLKKNAEKPMENLNFTRKIFSDTKKLLATLQYENKQINVRFIDPIELKFTQEKYIEGFVQPVLVKLKSVELKLKPSLNKVKVGGEEFIELISLENVEKLESFELIVDSIEKILKNPP
jgi:hypothetical protein